jgi:integrase
MATILTRKRKDGTPTYTARIRIRRKDVRYHECETFSRLTPAKDWARRREVELEDSAALAVAGWSPLSLASLIAWYRETFEQTSGWQRTKSNSLTFLEKQPFAQTHAADLTTQALVEYVRQRREGAGPATVAGDLTWIGVVLRAAKSVRGEAVRPDIVKEARDACKELRLVGKSRKRTRRPSPAELQQLDDHFARQRRGQIPMRDIVQFAVASSRREAEICRLEWTDNDDARTGLVRDAKHPRLKQGNHKRFKYTPEGWEIVQRQPRTSSRIFPYNPRSVSTTFTRACHLLGIADLTFHDLRHEATSRLFEQGYVIHEVAQFTLHESWNELKRYTNLNPKDVRDIHPPALSGDGGVSLTGTTS